MLSMYCFRGLPRLRLPSTHPSASVLVIWQPWYLQRCPKYERLRLLTCPINSRFMSSSCRILMSVLFPIQLIRFLPRQSHISIDVIFRSSSTFRVQDKTVHTGWFSSPILRFAIAMRAFTSLDYVREPMHLKCIIISMIILDYSALHSFCFATLPALLLRVSQHVNACNSIYPG